jgi:hypothetical protein
MITSQAECPERLQWAMDAGGLLWDPKQSRYWNLARSRTERLSKSPHIVGITRELEFSRPGSWVGSLFDYHPPRCGFTPSERRLLIRAISNRSPTDAILARDLRISLPTIKKTWLSIYDRFSRNAPELFAEEPNTGAKRGKEKRRRLLAYLHDHLEELRPTARRKTVHRSR